MFRLYTTVWELVRESWDKLGIQIDLNTFNMTHLLVAAIVFAIVMRVFGRRRIRTYASRTFTTIMVAQMLIGAAVVSPFSLKEVGEFTSHAIVRLAGAVESQDISVDVNPFSDEFDCTVNVTDAHLFLREGPGKNYTRLELLDAGESLHIVEVVEGGDYPGGNLWGKTTYTNSRGALRDGYVAINWCER